LLRAPRTGTSLAELRRVAAEQLKSEPSRLKHRWVHFKIRDVYVPDVQMLLLEVYGDDLLQGKVLDISDSGSSQGAFAVVEVEGIKQQLIVPIQRILGVV
jgi:hypothetical protein